MAFQHRRHGGDRRGAVVPPVQQSPALTSFRIATLPVILTVGDPDYQAAVTDEGWTPDANGNVGISTYQWTSSNTGVFTVGLTTGLIHAVGAGAATLTASSVEYKAIQTAILSVTVVVTPTPFAIQLSVNSVAVFANATTAITGTVIDSVGSVIVGAAASVTWDTGNHAVATTSTPGATTTLTGAATGSTTLTATYGSLTATIAVEVDTVVVGYPNLPAGWPTLVEIDWTATAPTQSNTVFSGPDVARGVITGKMQRAGKTLAEGGASDNKIIQDAAYPEAPGHAWEMDYISGAPPGFEPGLFNVWHDAGPTTEIYNFYESVLIRVGSAATHDFQMQAATLKATGYWYGADGLHYPMPGNTGLLIGYFRNTTGNTLPLHTTNDTSWSGLNFGIEWGLTGQGGVDVRDMTQNRNPSKTFTAGDWHRWETLVIAQSAVGVADGVCRIWLDGILTHEYTNVMWRTATYSRGFFRRHWACVWGGSGGPNRSRDDKIDVGHLYIAGF